jgi:hypothetical protein
MLPLTPPVQKVRRGHVHHSPVTRKGRDTPANKRLLPRLPQEEPSTSSCVSKRSLANRDSKGGLTYAQATALDLFTGTIRLKEFLEVMAWRLDAAQTPRERAKSSRQPATITFGTFETRLTYILRGVKAFVNGSSPLEPRQTDDAPKEQYANLKAQCTYLFAEAVKVHRIAIRTEDTTERQITIEDLEEMKSKGNSLGPRLRFSAARNPWTNQALADAELEPRHGRSVISTHDTR